MNVERIEELVAELAKSGDRETISNIIELLKEVSSFKVKIKKDVVEHISKKPVKQESMLEHAHSILDGLPDDKYVPANLIQPTFKNDTSEKKEQRDYADRLL